jgi:hypothetical protein
MAIQASNSLIVRRCCRRRGRHSISTASTATLHEQVHLYPENNLLSTELLFTQIPTAYRFGKRPIRELHQHPSNVSQNRLEGEGVHCYWFLRPESKRPCAPQDTEQPSRSSRP